MFVSQPSHYNTRDCLVRCTSIREGRPRVALRVRCSNGHALSVKDDLAGQRVRCPKCKVLFRAQAEAETEENNKPETPLPPTPSKKKKKSPSGGQRRPSVEDDDEGGDESSGTPEERRKERQRDKKRRLAQVSTGLILHTVKLWVLVVLVFFIFLWAVFGNTIANARLPNVDQDLDNETVKMFESTVDAFQKIILVLVVLMPVVGVIGTGFCYLIPKKSESRGTIVTALIFDFIPLIASIMIPLAVFGSFDLEKDKNDRLLYLLVAGSVFFSIAALFLFVIFVRLLGYYIQKALLASEALNLVSWLMIMTAAAPVALLGMKYLSPLIVGAVGSIVNMGLLFIITLVWFGTFYLMFFKAMLRLLGAERAAIAEIT
jgi:hypothetical protein